MRNHVTLPCIQGHDLCARYAGYLMLFAPEDAILTVQGTFHTAIGSWPDFAPGQEIVDCSQKPHHVGLMREGSPSFEVELETGKWQRVYAHSIDVVTIRTYERD